MKVNMGSDIIEVDGNLVERDALRVAEAIIAYDDNLRVLCLDPARAEGISDAPFVIVAKYKDRDEWYPVLRAWELNDDVLARIQSADMQRTDVLGNVMQSEENWKKANQKRYEEVRDLMKEQAVAIAAHQKVKYVLKDEITGDYITFRDDAPAVRGNPSGLRYFT